MLQDLIMFLLNSTAVESFNHRGLSIYMQTLYKQLFFKGKIAQTRVYKNHLKMVKGCRIDTGQYKKALSKKDPPKTFGTRVSCKTGTWLDGQRARQA